MLKVILLVISAIFLYFMLITAISGVLRPVVAEAASEACPAGQEQAYQGSTLTCVPIGSAAGTTTQTKDYYPNSQIDDVSNNPIIKWIKDGINLLSAIVGIGAIIMIIIAGLQYSAARDNPQAIQAAKTRMVNVLIGLAAFIFMYAFMQWLIPGGVF